MSIKINDLCKRYGTQDAVLHASFEIEKGMVVGLLGANGAGKSTIMKILMGYLKASSGKACVCDVNVASNPLTAKKLAGYLPEHNPLYLDMYIPEYLQFVHQIYSLPKRNTQKNVRNVMEMTGLMPEKSKKIGQLSKGYRQRVGLAQALIHDPQVLILDEPTAGLDPNQLAEIRSLIAQIGQQKTIMLSTHIMQEVEAVCSKVIIMNKGQIVAYDTPQNVRRMAQSANSLPVEIKLMEKTTLSDWQTDFIHHAEPLSDTEWRLFANSEEDIRPKLFHYVVQKNWTLLEMKQKQQQLEQAFRTLTV